MDLEILSKYDLIDLAWVAGILEGEGSFTIFQGRYPRITCGSVDLDVLEKVQSILQVGNIRKNCVTVTKKQFYLYEISVTKDVINVLHLILPFMCKRRSSKIEMLLQIVW